MAASMSFFIAKCFEQLLRFHPGWNGELFLGNTDDETTKTCTTLQHQQGGGGGGGCEGNSSDIQCCPDGNPSWSFSTDVYISSRGFEPLLAHPETLWAPEGYQHVLPHPFTGAWDSTLLGTPGDKPNWPPTPQLNRIAGSAILPCPVVPTTVYRPTAQPKAQRPAVVIIPAPPRTTPSSIHVACRPSKPSPPPPPPPPPSSHAGPWLAHPAIGTHGPGVCLVPAPAATAVINSPVVVSQAQASDQPHCTNQAQAAAAAATLAPQCTHRQHWKRLRMRNGYHHFVCTFCGAKWKTRSSVGLKRD